MEYLLITIIILVICYLIYSKSDELVQLYFLLLALPFSVVFIYVIDKDYNWYSAKGEFDFFRNAANDPYVMNIVFLVGFSSILSFFLAKLCLDLSILRGFKFKLRLPSNGVIKYSPFLSTIILIIALYLNSLSARTLNIFDYNYGELSDPPLSGGSYLLGYTLILLVILKHNRALKKNIFTSFSIVLALTYEIIFNQFLVGSRESIGLIVSIFIIYKYRLINNNFIHTYNFIKIIFFLIILLYLSLGAFRSVLSVNPDSIYSSSLISIFNNNPWNSILLSVLGFSDQFLQGQDILQFAYYQQLFMKIPPGFLSNLFFSSELDSTLSDPGHWYADYTTGGAYYPIVIFRSFGFVFGTLALTLMFLVLLSASKLIVSSNLYLQLLYLILIIISFRWFWYGDIDLIRGLQAWLITCFFDMILSTGVKYKT